MSHSWKTLETRWKTDWGKSAKDPADGWFAPEKMVGDL